MSLYMYVLKKCYDKGIFDVDVERQLSVNF